MVARNSKGMCTTRRWNKSWGYSHLGCNANQCSSGGYGRHQQSEYGGGQEFSGYGGRQESSGYGGRQESSGYRQQGYVPKKVTISRNCLTNSPLRSSDYGRQERSEYSSGRQEYGSRDRNLGYGDERPEQSYGAQGVPGGFGEESQGYGQSRGRRTDDEDEYGGGSRQQYGSGGSGYGEEGYGRRY